MARRCRRMVVLAFLTHAGLELSGFVGSWRAQGKCAPTHPKTHGVKAVGPTEVVGTLSAGASLFDFINRQWMYFKSTFLTVTPLPPGEEVQQHVKSLVELVDSAQREGSIIPQHQLVPEQPVEGTEFQQLMITVLNDNRTGGLSAVHAEPGVGKSVAAAMALRNYTQKSAVTVMLQGDFQKNVRTFFRLPDGADAVDVAPELFRMLRDRGIRLQMVFDNTFDSGLQGQETNLMTLTRFAHEFDHHLIAITQTDEAANKIANLNGARTRKVEQQEAPSYRWSKGQAEEYLKAMKMFTGKAERVLNMTQVPDEVGRWKPVDIKEYVKTGRRPEAPQQGQGGRSTANPAVWVRQLQKDGDTFKQIGNAFQVKGELANVDGLKKAIKKEEELSIAPSKIDIFSQQDGSWIREEKMSASLRDTDETDCYGFTLPSA